MNCNTRIESSSIVHYAGARHPKLNQRICAAVCKQMAMALIDLKFKVSIALFFVG